MTDATLAGVDEVVPGRAPHSATAVLRGRFDAVRAPAVRADLETLVADGVRELVVDLDAAGFVDSAALAVLVRTRRAVTALGGRVSLVLPRSPEAARVFSLTQFDQIFPLVGPGERP